MATQEDGHIATYNLGENGVVLIMSPVHGEDGELSAAQNATPSSELGLAGLQKRRGMVKLNANAANGALLSFMNVPLTDPTP